MYQKPIRDKLECRTLKEMLAAQGHTVEGQADLGEEVNITYHRIDIEVSMVDSRSNRTGEGQSQPSLRTNYRHLKTRRQQPLGQYHNQSD
jgi:uncharacterized protein (UPF0248 family)